MTNTYLLAAIAALLAAHLLTAVFRSVAPKPDAASQVRLDQLEANVNQLLEHAGLSSADRNRAHLGDRDLEMLIRSGHKIDAIKLYRQRYGVDLKAAKEAVDRIAATIGETRTK